MSGGGEPVPYKHLASMAVVVAACACASPAFAASSNSAAGDYPNRPVRFIVAQAPGGNADFVSRAITAELARRLGQQFVVDNRPGASGIVAGEIAVRAPADGYTLLLVGSTFAVNPSLYKKIPYDPLRDLAPITLATSAPNILVVNPALAVHSVKDLIQLARAKPGQLNYGSSAMGG